MSTGPLGRQKLHELVVDALTARLRAAAGARLPSETQLAQELGVSRATVREALRILEAQGMVRRRHGVGSFVSPHGFVEAGIERLESFSETIARAGYRPSSELLSLSQTSLPEEVAAALQVPSPLGFEAQTLYRADGAPILFSVVYVPLDVVRSLQELEGRRHWTSMREFFNQELRRPVRYARLAVLAVAAPEGVAGHLALEPGAPVLVMEGVSYGDDDDPLMFTRAYFRTDKYRFTLVRR
jgi:GntR family transcriptional regulator